MLRKHIFLPLQIQKVYIKFFLLSSVNFSVIPVFTVFLNSTTESTEVTEIMHQFKIWIVSTQDGHATAFFLHTALRVE